MKIFCLHLIVLLAGLFLHSCGNPVASQSGKNHLYQTQLFKNYWYAGKAEISTFRLEQSRYGEVREGKAVLIFVTEDFSRQKQVKLDEPEKSANDKVTVLKLNFTKNFVTGIYPYSLMLSVFTPIERESFPHTLKTTMTSQEWCGQVFTQLNLDNKKYRIQSNSYFEKEGDQSTQLKVAWLEDELWNLIRLDPNNLPIGKIEIIPGLFFSRLLHTPMEVVQALATVNEEDDAMVYSISVPSLTRTLSIRYDKNFPHRIRAWEERFVERGKPVLTKALLDKTIITDYWTKNRNEFIGLRDSLGLSRKNY
jgi:hypothetical protein